MIKKITKVYKKLQKYQKMAILGIVKKGSKKRGAGGPDDGGHMGKDPEKGVFLALFYGFSEIDPNR